MPTLAERTAPFKYFDPLSETRVFDVQPLLTPDNYHEHALALINSASEELLIQNQTFNAPKPTHAKLRELLSAVLAKQKAGVEVTHHLPHHHAGRRPQEPGGLAGLRLRHGQHQGAEELPHQGHHRRPRARTARQPEPVGTGRLAQPRRQPAVRGREALPSTSPRSSSTIGATSRATASTSCRPAPSSP